MVFIDYYKILGLGKEATPKEIKSAYRKLARKYHPDLHPNDRDAKRNFQQVNEANEVLSDPEKRKKYDEYGKDWQHADEFEKAKRSQSRQPGSRGAGYSEPAFEGDFSDFFESLFGGAASTGRTRQARYRGEDYKAELHLDLISACQTHQQTFTVNGENIRITVPAGVGNGQTIKIAGHGGSGLNGGPDGDLYITFSIAEHPQFIRSGNNLSTVASLDLFTAILGGEITIDTLNGKVKLKVKPGTQNGSKVKLKGKGCPIYKTDGQSGDLFVTYSIKIPTNLSDQQKALFAEIRKLSNP